MYKPKSFTMQLTEILLKFKNLHKTDDCINWIVYVFHTERQRFKSMETILNLWSILPAIFLNNKCFFLNK